nr:MAG: hypothetical protein [Prevotella phage R001]
MAADCHIIIVFRAFTLVFSNYVVALLSSRVSSN